MTRQDILEAIKNNRTIENMDLTGVDLSHADLTGGRFENVAFRNANLSGAKNGIQKM